MSRSWDATRAKLSNLSHRMSRHKVMGSWAAMGHSYGPTMKCTNRGCTQTYNDHQMRPRPCGGIIINHAPRQ